MWNRKKNRIAELEAWRQQLVEGRQAAIDTALADMRREHGLQCARLAERALHAEAGAKRVQQHNDALRQENEDLREQVQTLQSHSALVALDGEYEALFDRLRRALRGCARWRHEAAELSQLARSQQRQLDAALGMDDADIAAGKDWQHRRPDKPLTLSRASAPLPAQEPGLTAEEASYV